MPKRKDWVKLTWYERTKLKKFFTEGFHENELAIMYKVEVWQVKELVRGLVKPERI